MKRGRTDRETCALNGWTVGTRLVGDEGYGPSIIRITAIGESRLLASLESHNGAPYNDMESVWALRYREWTEVPS